MANWNTLKPLKIHSVVLKIVAAILLIILIVIPRHAFKDYNFNIFTNINDSTSYVIAYSGLSIRDLPNTKGNLLITAPYKTKLNILQKNVKYDKINGKSGYWYKVEYQGIKGFAFGSFINDQQ